MNPFRIESPAVISFSGGRTSAYMLRRILDAHDGALPEGVYVAFANTGKERPETLDFVRDCGAHWGLTIFWLERVKIEGSRASFRLVDHVSASRNGEPFEALVLERKFLPNPVTRYCTSELKVRVMRDFMLSLGHDEWTNVVGIRADEPRRVSKMRAGKWHRQWEIAMPLAEAGVSERDILAFWKTQAFDLRLQPWEGNCDLCFLKGASKIQRVMRDRPDLAQWWNDMEARLKATFRSDRPSYRALLDATRRQVQMFEDQALDDLGDCVCHEGTTEAA